MYPVLTEEQFKTLVGIRNHIANMGMQGFVYPNWSDEFAREEFKRTVENLKSSDYVFNISDLDHAQADALGFGRWDAELNLRLFPLWIAPFLANGTRCASIPIGDEPPEEFDYHVDMTDLDHRFGSLAFGPAFIGGRSAGAKVKQ